MAFVFIGYPILDLAFLTYVHKAISHSDIQLKRFKNIFPSIFSLCAIRADLVLFCLIYKYLDIL